MSDLSGRAGDPRNRRRHVGLATAALAVVAAAGVAGCAATTQPASDVTSRAALLNARGHTDATPAHFHFEYGIERDGALPGTPFRTLERGPVPAGVPGAGRGEIAFGERVTNLIPGTTYRFRICGRDGQITADVCGGERTFTTPAGTPGIAFAPTAGWPFARSGFAWSAALGDFDGDGVQDAAYALDGTGPALAVRLADGRGGFGVPRSVAFEDRPGGLLARDVDGDRRVDLVVTTLSGATVLHRGDGAGGFAAPSVLAAAPEEWTGTTTPPVAGDLDRDGDLDLVVPRAGERLAVLRTDGDGGFTAEATTDLVGRAALGDTDQDGRLDIVAADSLDNYGRLVLALGTGTAGTAFGPVRATAAPAWRWDKSPLLGDVDRDGDLDLVAGNVLLRGDGRGGLAAPTGLDRSGGAVALADVDTDGRLDLITVRSEELGFDDYTQSLMVAPGNGDGSFATPSVVTSGRDSDYVSVAAGDATGDGAPDVLFLGNVGNGSSNVPFAGLARTVLGGS